VLAKLAEDSSGMVCRPHRALRGKSSCAAWSGAAPSGQATVTVMEVVRRSMTTKLESGAREGKRTSAPGA